MVHSPQGIRALAGCIHPYEGHNGWVVGRLLDVQLAGLSIGGILSVPLLAPQFYYSLEAQSARSASELSANGTRTALYLTPRGAHQAAWG
jgi:hypothetical protein